MSRHVRDGIDEASHPVLLRLETLEYTRLRTVSGVGNDGRISVGSVTRESRVPADVEAHVPCMGTLRYMRTFADADGSSHLEPAELELASKDFVPPAPPIDVSALHGAVSCAFLRVPSGYVGEWHPSPKRQWLFFLAGEMEFTMTDGTVYTGRPGSAVLLEDTTGRGHQSRVLGADAVMAAVQLA